MSTMYERFSPSILPIMEQARPLDGSCSGATDVVIDAICWPYIVI